MEPTSLTILCLAALLAAAVWKVWHLTRRLRRATRNASAMRRKIAQARKASNFHRVACSNTDDGLVIQSLDGRVQWVNPAYCRIMGYAAEEVIGRNPMEYCLRPSETPPDEVIRNFQYRRDDPNWGRLSLYRNVRKDGEEFWNQIRVSFHEDEDGSEYVILVCRDVSAEVDRENELREKSAELAHVAAHDVLTGVANRARMMQFAQEAVAAAKANGGKIGLLQFDLDKFKHVNDTYGHSAGDAVLRHVTDKVGQTLRKSDLLARMGGDEFVAICTQINTEKELLKLGAALVDCVRTPLSFEGQTLTPSVSIGAALSHSGDCAVEDLLKKADLALYQVKRAGRGHVAIYDAKLHRDVQRRSRRSDDLQRAILNDQIHHVFQPTVAVETGKVFSVEALARWTDPDGVTHAPDNFMPLARDMGLSRQIDQCSLIAAMDAKAQLDAAGLGHVRVAMNVSPEMIEATDYVMELRNAARQRGIDHRSIQIELHERIVMEAQTGDVAKRDTIAELIAQGFCVTLDGFSAGIAGLMHLCALQITGFKTAATLTTNVTVGSPAQKALQMVNTLARDHDLTAVMVGIAKAAEFDAVRAAGARYVQGNLIAQPMPVDALIDWVQSCQSDPSHTGIPHLQLPPEHRIAI